MRKIEIINQLIEIGKISDAFNQATKFANINGTYTKELKVLKARYSIFKNQLNLGIINYGDNTDFNKIITSFLNLLEASRNYCTINRLAISSIWFCASTKQILNHQLIRNNP